MAKKTYADLDRLAVRLAHRQRVDLEALNVPDRVYVTMAANRLDLVGNSLAQELRFLGAAHLSALIERWAEGGDPSGYDLESPAIRD
ncbi:hypothetical protein [Pseudomonas putida]